MKALLNELYTHKTLSRAEAKQALLEIGEGKHNAAQIASFVTVFNMRNITVEELEGFKDAMLELCLRIDLSAYNAIDIVGTGGDGKDTFNISTTSAFVVVGAGYKVAKHGNYGVSSNCGSSNVLQYLGLNFTNEEAELQRSIEETGFCMMHAPLFHPAMKHVAPIRGEMGVRTFFNMLGPIINPSFPKNRFLGTYNLELARLYGYLHQQSTANYTILHALDGYDEVSLTCPVKLIGNRGEQLLTPEELGFKKYKASDLSGGVTVATSAEILVDILENNGTEAQTSVVLANAALAIYTIDQTCSYEEAKEKAIESLKSERAIDALKKFIQLSS